MGEGVLTARAVQGEKRLLNMSNLCRKKPPSPSRICFLTYVCIPTNKLKKQKLCTVHFGDRFSLLCVYFLTMILIVAILIPISLLYPHFVPELALLRSFLYTISPSEQLSRIANAGRSMYRQCVFCFISKYWGVHLHVLSVPLSAATTQDGSELCFRQAHTK